MDSVKGEVDFGIQVNFRCRKEHQKYLIEFILTCSCLKHSDLAELLEVSPLMLDQTRIGSADLSGQAVIQLVEIFCMLFDD